MHLCRWVVYVCTAVVLSLMVPGLPGTASAQSSDENNVSFVWAFEALVAEGNVRKQVPIKEDVKDKMGCPPKVAREPPKAVLCVCDPSWCTRRNPEAFSV